MPGWDHSKIYQFYSKYSSEIVYKNLHFLVDTWLYKELNAYKKLERENQIKAWIITLRSYKIKKGEQKRTMWIFEDRYWVRYQSDPIFTVIVMNIQVSRLHFVENGLIRIKFAKRCICRNF